MCMKWNLEIIGLEAHWIKPAIACKLIKKTIKL